MVQPGTTFILKSLRITDFCFQNTLKDFTMFDCGTKSSHLDALLLGICPKFPNLSELCLFYNKIESFRAIVDTIKNDSTCTISKSIRHFPLKGNPVMKKIKEGDSNEKKALLSLLDSFNTIYKLGYKDEVDYDSDVEYALRINHAGRSIVKGGDHSLPLSVWHIILERSYQKYGGIYDDSSCHRNKKDPTGLFYLLCNMPALVGRLDLGDNGKLPSSLSSSSLSSSSLSSSSDGGDDGDGDGDEVQRKDPSKRKLAVETKCSTDNLSKRSCYG